MPTDFINRTDLLESGWATVLMGPLAVALALAWVWSVRARGRSAQPAVEPAARGAAAKKTPSVSPPTNDTTRFSPLRLFAGLAGAAVATLALWCTFQFLSQFLTLGTTWSLWIPAILGGLALELIGWLYQLEKNLVTRNRGRLILGLRLAALVILVLILVEPILSTLVDREINREVAILIDDSASMQLSDQRLSITEMLDRAAVFGIDAVADRPALGDWQQRLRGTRNGLSATAAAFRSALPAPPASQYEQLRDSLISAREDIDAVSEKLDSTANSQANSSISGEARNRLTQLRQSLIEDIRRPLEEALKNLAAANPSAEEAKAVSDHLTTSVEKLDQLDTRWQADTTQYDSAWYEQLNDEQKKSVTQAAARPRLELAVATLRQAMPDKIADTEAATESETEEPDTEHAEVATFLAQLGERYDLRFQRFARNATTAIDLDTLIGGEPGDPENTETEVPDADSPQDSDDEEETLSADTDADANTFTTTTTTSEGALTDLSGALNYVLDNTSPETLAGVLLLSDGRHNGPVPVEDALRRMAVQKSPLGAVAIGGRLGPVDASILSLSAPESIYLGDRVSVRTVVKLDGLRGSKVKAVLRNGDEIVDEKTIEVSDVNQRQELRFVHLPDKKGIFDYGVELIPVESELFANNNRWNFKLAVTDDRTNVLLVDSYPRWEFRYLRNLFYGRDKSVHLQYVLLDPDTIEGTSPSKMVSASATRDFGDAEAHRLPENEEEWRQFDVIIFGDIAPTSINSDTWKIIADSVEERGTLFVSIAGPRYMPHAFDNENFRRLMPVAWQTTANPVFGDPKASYSIELSNEGRSHPVTQQAASRSENSRIWSGLQPMHWRFIPESVKDSAEVIAYASPDDGENRSAGGAFDGSLDSVEAAIERLANRKTFEKENALITVQRNGLGKVVSIGFDQTWRMRYGIGDTLHHRFWGQVVRWGTGENLRSGNNFIRLGTDRLSYTPSDDVNITVKLLDRERRPITDAEAFAIVERDGTAVDRQRLSYRSSSNGIYETSLADLPGPGEYTIRIEGDAISTAIADDAELDQLETEFMVVNTRNPVELAELTADRDALSRAAQMTGGSMVEVNGVDTLLDLFGAPRETLTERRDVTLWDTWPLLLTFLGLVTTEWVVRRRSGLT